jgi:hypothetical protein
MVHSLPARDRQIISLARYVLIRYSIHPPQRA